MAAVSMAGMASLLSNIVPEIVDPVVVKLPSPPSLTGPLSPNDHLMLTKAYAYNKISGPESMVIATDDSGKFHIYTGLKDGWIVHISPDGNARRILRMSIRSCGHSSATEDACGRPLGVRQDRGYLVVADAYNGIFRVNPRTGEFRQLVDARNQLVNGKPMGFINDLDIAKDGTVFFTSSSSKWKPSQFLNILFDGETSGRVLVYNPREILATRRIQELVTGLHYPNGVQLAPDESYLLIAEGGRSRIHRAWIGRRTPKFGQLETFAENLPGFADNIRLSPRGTFWVALSRARHANLPSVLDTYGDKPEVRKNLINLVNQKMVVDEPSFGIVVELDQQGAIVRSLQDPQGTVYSTISEVTEVKDVLFIASKDKSFVGVIDLNSVPKMLPPTPLESVIGNHVVDVQTVQDPTLKELLTKVQTRLTSTGREEIMSMALMLVRQLYEARMEAARIQQQIAQLRADLERLQQAVQQSMQSGLGAGGGPTYDTSPSNTTSPTNTTTSPDTTSWLPAVTLPPPDQGGNSAPAGSVDGGTGAGNSTDLGPGVTDPVLGGSTSATTSPSVAGTTPVLAGSTTDAPSGGGMGPP